MSTLLGEGTDPSHIIITETNERWVSWTRDNNIYVRKRNINSIWESEILLNPGYNSTLHFFDGKIHLDFEYLDKIFYRFWNKDETPVYLKPPGSLMDCARFDVSVPYLNLNLPYPPTTFFRFGIDKLYWETPSNPIMGEKILGYNVYENSESGIVKLNPELVQEGLFTYTLQNNCFYFVKTVVYSGYGNREYLGKKSSYIYIDPNEIWGSEDIETLDSKSFNKLTDFVFITYQKEENEKVLGEKCFTKSTLFIPITGNYEESLYSLACFGSYKSVLYDEEGHVVG